MREKLKGKNPSEIFKKVMENMKNGIDSDIEIDPEIKEKHIKEVEKRAKFDNNLNNLTSLVSIFIILIIPFISFITLIVSITLELYKIGFSNLILIKFITTLGIILLISLSLLIVWFLIVVLVAVIVGNIRKFSEIMAMKKVIKETLKEKNNKN